MCYPIKPHESLLTAQILQTGIHPQFAIYIVRVRFILIIMKITFEEALSRKEWLHTELMNSLTGDLITQASEDRFYDVKLLVNGVELEPELFNKIVNNIEKYIDEQAKSLVREKLEEAENKVRRLSELFDEVAYKIKDEFNLDEREF
jgi:hypothetical protein